MKFLFALLALTPLVYCATLTHEEQLIIQAMTETQKRAFLPHIPSLHDVKNAICKVLNSDITVQTCAAACPLALDLIPYGSLASPLCGPACSAIHC